MFVALKEESECRTHLGDRSPRLRPLQTIDWTVSSIPHVAIKPFVLYGMKPRKLGYQVKLVIGRVNQERLLYY